MTTSQMKKSLPTLGAYHAGEALMPEPEPSKREFTVISVDDHLVEPPHMFDNRLPKHLQGLAPRVVEHDDGSEVWCFENVLYPQIATGAAVGRPKERWGFEATSFRDIRPGCYNIEARIRDMDIDGVWAQLNFPSLIAGMAGGLFYSGTKNAELGYALSKVWNDWFYDEWYSPYPDRSIPCGITWLGDAKLAAEEVRRNAARGFRALSFPNSPPEMGLPSIYTGYWDPLFEACEETGTVLCLHIGSDGRSDRPAQSPFEVAVVCFPLGSYRTAADWLWSGVPSRYPKLNIALSEGGIAWVPMLMDRLDYVMEHSAAAAGEGWSDRQHHPVEILRRNFHYCSVEFSSGIDLREKIGIDRIMVETDYPHADSTWPNTQAMLSTAMANVPAEEVSKITWQNAANLFGVNVPKEVLAAAPRS